MLLNGQKNNYELNIISKDDRANGKKLKKYNIDNTDVVGVFDNEEFEVELKNNTSQRIQVRISIDGTDILTGEEAKLDSSGEMWLIEPYGTLSLKSWPETMKGGAKFLFGTTKDSVAANTHGNLSSKGIISAAVYTEGYINPFIYNNYITNYNGYNPGDLSVGDWSACSGSDLFSSSTVQFKSICANNSVNLISEKGPAVGAGEYAVQEIKKTAGLIQPIFNQIIVVKYKWWNELRTVLRKTTPVETMADVGFPGEKKLIDLKNTPRKNTKKQKQVKRKYVEYHRFV